MCGNNETSSSRPLTEVTPKLQNCNTPCAFFSDTHISFMTSVSLMPAVGSETVLHKAYFALMPALFKVLEAKEGN